MGGLMQNSPLSTMRASKTSAKCSCHRILIKCGSEMVLPFLSQMDFTFRAWVPDNCRIMRKDSAKLFR
eukprot:8514237-Karenia_brevis.AAC.1